MVRNGFYPMTIDIDTLKEIDRIAQERNCKTRPEALRLLLRAYKEMEARDKAQNLYKESANSGNYVRMPPFTSGDEDEPNFSTFM